MSMCGCVGVRARVCMCVCVCVCVCVCMILEVLVFVLTCVLSLQCLAGNIKLNVSCRRFAASLRQTFPP